MAFDRANEKRKIAQLQEFYDSLVEELTLHPNPRLRELQPKRSGLVKRLWPFA